MSTSGVITDVDLQGCKVAMELMVRRTAYCQDIIRRATRKKDEACFVECDVIASAIAHVRCQDSLIYKL